ncbi:MAG: hypothetical protein AB7O59_23975 [Pirellulales bacterium]
MSTATSWHVDNNLARLHFGRLAAQVNLLEPASGLHQLCADAQTLFDCQILRVDVPPVAAAALSRNDYFLRGGDLAVSYGDRPERAMRTQIYWRAAPGQSAGVIATIELLISVETSLLDSCPRISTSSRLSSGRVFRIAATSDVASPDIADDRASAIDPAAPVGHVFQFENGGAKFSYAEMVHPDDARSTQVLMPDGGSGRPAELRHELFAERLEKGVILRARVLGVLLERTDDARHAAGVFTDFLRAELPLTT